MDAAPGIAAWEQDAVSQPAWRQPSAESGSNSVWFRARREYMGSEAPQFRALTQLRLEVGKGKAGQRQIERRRRQKPLENSLEKND